MDIINILVGMALIVSIGANFQGAKKGLKTSLIKVVDKPKIYLQSLPSAVSALIFVLVVLGIFGIGSLNESLQQKYINFRIGGLIAFIFFAWLQVFSYKSLKEFYSQDILILKNHELVTKGIYRFIRHPQYISQVLSDLGAGIALMNYLVIPAVILLELVLFILRARFEDKLLAKYFGEEYTAYKKRSGFFIPFIG